MPKYGSTAGEIKKLLEEADDSDLVLMEILPGQYVKVYLDFSSVRDTVTEHPKGNKVPAVIISPL